MEIERKEWVEWEYDLLSYFLGPGVFAFAGVVSPCGGHGRSSVMVAMLLAF